MQTIETIALAVFLLMYLMSAVRALTAPMAFREAELSFYKTGKPGPFLLANFVLGSLAFALVVVHLLFETPRIAEGILYFQVVMFEIVLPFHFMPFFRQRMVNTLGKKTADQYRSLGWKRIAIAVVMVAVPLLYHQ
jgi:hypothetical protein